MVIFFIDNFKGDTAIATNVIVCARESKFSSLLPRASFLLPWSFPFVVATVQKERFIYDGYKRRPLTTFFSVGGTKSRRPFSTSFAHDEHRFPIPFDDTSSSFQFFSPAAVPAPTGNSGFLALLLSSSSSYSPTVRY